jgi:FlaA1/EpsC-like NDP-sugar epimerase
MGHLFPGAEFMSLYLLRTGKTAVDLMIFSMAFWVAAIFHLGAENTQVNENLLGFPLAIILAYVICASLGLSKSAWGYFGLHDASRLFLGLGATSVLLLIASSHGRAVLNWIPASPDYFLVPDRIILMYFTLSFMGIAGIRSATRLSRERAARLQRAGSADPMVPTIFIGAGQAGVMVAKEVANHPDLKIQPIGFLDDDPAKQAVLINGLPVLGTTAQLSEVLREHKARQAIITIANASASFVRRISELCKTSGVALKMIPGVYEIVSGGVNVTRVRDVAIEDLLRRDPVVLDHDAISRVVQNRVVMVSGAGGSIGSELCHQICRFRPQKLLLVEHTENSLFHIGRQLHDKFPEISRVPCLADIRDPERMEKLFRKYKPQVVFHAAAHKHVPMMEDNPGEAIKNNVLGTKQLADLAHRFEVGEFVMISTDKAVNPTSVMGVSKRVAEIYIQALSQRSDTRFITVRFGNVLGSAGSVIPIFEEQIRRGGPVTITHPEMKRYFMTIPEACQLVLQAASMGNGGDIMILDMGQPVKIVDLARDLIRLSGLRPDVDIEIRYTGLRPGEKLFEELAVSNEHADKMRHPKIFVGRFRPYLWENVTAFIHELSKLSDCPDGNLVRSKFKEFVPEYQPWLAGVVESTLLRGSRRILEAVRKCSQRIAKISARFLPDSKKKS